MSTYSKAEIRSAILRAADRIERNPKLYDYNSLAVPECGTPGCLWGWIGFELGIGAGAFNTLVALSCGKSTSDLYTFGCEIAPRYNLAGMYGADAAAKAAAKVLRAYADKHFPAKPALDPAFVALRDSMLREWDALDDANSLCERVSE